MVEQGTHKPLVPSSNLGVATVQCLMVKTAGDVGTCAGGFIYVLRTRLCARRGKLCKL